MNNYVFLLVGLHAITAAPPLKLTIDCSSQETDYPPWKAGNYGSRSIQNQAHTDIQSLCSIIHNALPKTVKDGKFMPIGGTNDQSRASNDQIPTILPPPRRFVPKLKVPRIKVPKFHVPKLKSAKHFGRPFSAPRVGVSMKIPLRGRHRDEGSSAERMERFKNGVQKMLHVVKVLGQIDHYLTERTRIIVDILSRTISEPSNY